MRFKAISLLLGSGGEVGVETSRALFLRVCAVGKPLYFLTDPPNIFGSSEQAERVYQDRSPQVAVNSTDPSIFPV